MALNDRTKSILLQVGAKLVVDGGLPTTDEKFEKEVTDTYLTLVGLHDKLGINPDDGPAPRKAAAAPAARRAAQVEKAAASTPDAPKITLADGVEYYDFRGLKSIGAIENPNFPDFKVAADPNKRGNSRWILKDGEATDFAVENGLA